MYRLVFKELGDFRWRYEDWVKDYQPILRRYKTKEFFVQNENYMIVYSS